MFGSGQELREVLDEKKVRDDINLKRRLDFSKIKIGWLFLWMKDPAREKSSVEVRVCGCVLGEYFCECVCGR